MPRSQRRTISGQTVMISGAGSGIGRALAQRLSGVGSPVAITDINELSLKETEASLPGPVLSRVLDVGDADAQQEFASAVRGWMPAPLGAVFNNAGVSVEASVLDGLPEDDDWLHQINFHGVVNGTRAFLPILVEQDCGAIVNTSSVFGLVGMPYNSAYCAAKFAVRGFTDSLRQELRGTGVSAINVHPGGISTNIVRNGRMRSDPRTRAVEGAACRGVRGDHPDLTGEGRRDHPQGRGAGKARILVGPDAYVFDALARVAPTHYFDIIAPLIDRQRRNRPA